MFIYKLIKYVIFTLCITWQSYSFSIPILDQSQLVGGGSSGFHTIFERAQTFTVGLTGQLNQIDISMKHISASSGLVFSLYNTTGGIPDEISLLSFTRPASLVNIGLNSFDLSLFDVFVNNGDQLAFGVRTDNTTSDVMSLESIGFSHSDPYPGGTIFLRDISGLHPTYPVWTQNPPASLPYEYDLVFSTFVDPSAAILVAEPISLSLYGLIFVMALSIRRSITTYKTKY